MRGGINLARRPRWRSVGSDDSNDKIREEQTFGSSQDITADIVKAIKEEMEDLQDSTSDGLDYLHKQMSKILSSEGNELDKYRQQFERVREEMKNYTKDMEQSFKDISSTYTDEEKEYWSDYMEFLKKELDVLSNYYDRKVKNSTSDTNSENNNNNHRRIYRRRADEPMNELMSYALWQSISSSIRSLVSDISGSSKERFTSRWDYAQRRGTGYGDVQEKTDQFINNSKEVGGKISTSDQIDIYLSLVNVQEEYLDQIITQFTELNKQTNINAGALQGYINWAERNNLTSDSLVDSFTEISKTRAYGADSQKVVQSLESIAGYLSPTSVNSYIDAVAAASKSGLDTSYIEKMAQTGTAYGNDSLIRLIAFGGGDVSKAEEFFSNGDYNGLNKYIGEMSSNIMGQGYSELLLNIISSQIGISKDQLKGYASAYNNGSLNTESLKEDSSSLQDMNNQYYTSTLTELENQSSILSGIADTLTSLNEESNGILGNIVSIFGGILGVKAVGAFSRGGIRSLFSGVAGSAGAGAGATGGVAGAESGVAGATGSAGISSALGGISSVYDAALIGSTWLGVYGAGLPDAIRSTGNILNEEGSYLGKDAKEQEESRYAGDTDSLIAAIQGIGSGAKRDKEQYLSDLQGNLSSGSTDWIKSWVSTYWRDSNGKLISSSDNQMMDILKSSGVDIGQNNWGSISDVVESLKSLSKDQISSVLNLKTVNSGLYGSQTYSLQSSNSLVDDIRQSLYDEYNSSDNNKYYYVALKKAFQTHGENIDDLSNSEVEDLLKEALGDSYSRNSSKWWRVGDSDRSKFDIMSWNNNFENESFKSLISSIGDRENSSYRTVSSDTKRMSSQEFKDVSENTKVIKDKLDSISIIVDTLGNIEKNTKNINGTSASNRNTIHSRSSSIYSYN